MLQSQIDLLFEDVELRGVHFEKRILALDFIADLDVDLFDISHIARTDIFLVIRDDRTRYRQRRTEKKVYAEKEECHRAFHRIPPKS